MSMFINSGSSAIHRMRKNLDALRYERYRKQPENAAYDCFR